MSSKKLIGATRRSLLVLSVWIAGLGLLLSPLTPGLATSAEAQRYAEFIPQDFILFWTSPVRAHPNVPLRFRFSVYEMNNQPLTWKLSNQPAGMTISSDGRVEWTPSAAQAGTHDVTVRVTRFDGAFRERTFRTTVNTSSFIFVSPSGNDANPGTIDRPLRTILKALTSVQNGIGRTIYLRGGTYPEVYAWETNGVYSPLREKNFSAADPLEIVGYPGESAILDCQFRGHGLFLFRTNYIVVDNLTIINSGASEGGGIITRFSHHVLVRDTVVRNSNYSYRNNVTGFQIGSYDTVLDGTIAHDNRDPTSESWNSSNYLFYLGEDSTGETIYVMNAKSWGSIAGFKVKHAGAKRVIMHKCEAFDHIYGFALGSENSSLRYSTSFGNKTGIAVGMADPNPWTDGGVLIDHNTVVNASASAMDLQGGYSVASPTVITNNIFANFLRPAGAGEDDGRLMQLWNYDAAAATHPIVSDHNLFFSPSQSNIVRLGYGPYKATSFSTWRSLGRDATSVFGDPGFLGLSNGNLGLAARSPAMFTDGTYVGSLRPGLTSSLVGLRSAFFPPKPPQGIRVRQLD